MKLHYIDLFCGAGGVTSGVEAAHCERVKCADVIACVNHDANAIASHLANHPSARHFTEDINKVDVRPIAGLADRIRAEHPEDYIVLWASAECTNFSRAKGGMARKADSRTLPESLYRYIEAVRPDYVEVENVVEFMSWGELDEAGHPVSKDKGRLYLKWVDTIRSYGYEYDYRILNAADYGAYTSRTRYFGLFARKGLPIVFPEPTHSRKDSTLKPWRAVRDVLEMDKEGESVFTRKKPLCEATCRRIMAGLRKFLSKQGEGFLMKNFSGDDASKCITLDGPAGTVTCKDHHSLVRTLFRKDARNGRALLHEGFRYLMTSGYGWPVQGIDRPSPTIVASQDKSPIYLMSVSYDGRLEDNSGDHEMMRALKRFCRDNGILDVKMRMLTVTELKRIMSFPEDYKLVGTQGQQKKYIGNAVDVTMSRCLCENLYRGVRQAGNIL